MHMDLFGNTNKTELIVFDLDGTLIRSPLPDTGRALFESKTGKPWPHKGWWAQPDSLNMEIFDIPTNPEVVAEFHVEKGNPNAVVILMTGRLTRLGEHVKAICDSKKLEFDGYFFNTGGSTDVVKIKQLNDLLDKHPQINVVKMFEDRLSHVVIFEEWGKNHCLSGRLKDFQITVVVNENRDSNH